MSLLYWLLGIDRPTSIDVVQAWEFTSTSSLPWAFVLIIAFMGLATAALNFLPHLALPWRMRVGLSVLRLVGFGLLALMLFQLELRLTFSRNLLPRVAVLTDTSASMGIKDEEDQTRLAAATAFAQKLRSALAERAQVSDYEFDWQLRALDREAEPQASGLTRIPGALQELLAREHDLQGVVLLTDGNDTGGDQGLTVTPLLSARGTPVYPVTFGRSTAPRRGQIRVAGASRYIRLGDDLVLDALLETNLEGEHTVRAALYQGKASTPLTTRENIRIGAEPVPVRFVIRPRQAGRVTYRIMLEGLPSADSSDRLAAEHTVDVIIAPIRVLYLDIPRDERKFLGIWLARDPIVDLASLTLMPKGGWYGQGKLLHANAGDGVPNRESDLYKYDIIILGDIPRSYWRSGGDVAETKMHWISEFVARRGGGLVTLGGRSVYAAGQYQESTLAELLPFQIEATKNPQVKKSFLLAPTALGMAHPILQLEADPALNREAWFDLPTLEGCNRVGAPKPSASLLAIRQDGEEELPIMAIHNVGKGKVLSLAVDTTWHWEMARELDAPDHYRRFWGNVARHLAPDPRLSPDRPRIRRSQSNYALGETVELSIQLVNDVFRPVREAELRVDVERPSGSTFAIYPLDGRDHGGEYRFRLALTEAGPWTVRAQHGKFNSEEILIAGESRDELEDPRARPDRMEALAKATEGRAFSPRQAEELLSALRLRRHQTMETRTVALWGLPVMLVLFLTCVTLDCLWRKRRGLV